MDDPTSILAAFDPTNTLGSLLIGGFIAVFLFGLSTVQTYLYYREYPKDHRPLKFMVAFVWICELAHTICITDSIYVAVITFYGQPEKLVKLPPALNLTVAFGAPVTAAVQMFYTDRIRRFIGRRIYIPISLWFLSGIRMIGSYVLVVVSFKIPSVTEYVADWGWMFTLLFTMGAFVDVAIAIALVANLYTHRKHVFSPTLKVLDRLIWWTIQTGLVTSIIAVAVVICFQTMKSNLIWITIYTCLGKVYSNSFMAVLNARNSFRNDEAIYEVNVPTGMLFANNSASSDTAQGHEMGLDRLEDTDIGSVSLHSKSIERRVA
ncbi:hypothetical protein BT96DRAFT_865865 [Gymnopus androsaceus JB14]|uniref:DUF6534 domain-containing protein n=1 Tax=Gymnopus androsaceus JB14 TaxID=1447944 RepID=A0A6A4GW72_9AGAR|nr:hypothetical protein BT96DRAFT_865865 [Gymnopus androsaceus JB14]